MNDKRKRCLKGRTKLMEFYHENGQSKEDQVRLETKAAYCTEQILKAKNDYILINLTIRTRS